MFVYRQKKYSFRRARSFIFGGMQNSAHVKVRFCRYELSGVKFDSLCRNHLGSNFTLIRSAKVDCDLRSHRRKFDSS